MAADGVGEELLNVLISGMNINRLWQGPKTKRQGSPKWTLNASTKIRNTSPCTFFQSLLNPCESILFDINVLFGIEFWIWTARCHHKANDTMIVFIMMFRQFWIENSHSTSSGTQWYPRNNTSEMDFPWFSLVDMSSSLKKCKKMRLVTVGPNLDTRGSSIACSTSSKATSRVSARHWLKESFWILERYNALINNSGAGALPALPTGCVAQIDVRCWSHFFVNALQCIDPLQGSQFQHASEGRPHISTHLLLGPFLTGHSR